MLFCTGIICQQLVHSQVQPAPAAFPDPKASQEVPEDLDPLVQPGYQVLLEVLEDQVLQVVLVNKVLLVLPAHQDYLGRKVSLGVPVFKETPVRYFLFFFV